LWAVKQTAGCSNGDKQTDRQTDIVGAKSSLPEIKPQVNNRGQPI